MQVVSLLIFLAPAFADIDTRGALKNFENFAPSLYRGGQPSKQGLADLKSKGIKTIINLRSSKDEVKEEEQLCHQSGIRFIHIPTGFNAPQLGTILAFLGVVTNPKMQPVYIHCRFGEDRTGMMIGLYRVIVQNWSYDQAYDEMRKHNFKPFLHSLKHTVEDWANSQQTDKERLVANSRLVGQI